MGAFIKSKIANKMIEKKVNKSLNIGNKIKILTVGIATTLSLAMLMFSEGMNVHADTVVHEWGHIHSSSTCSWGCGYIEGECEYWQDGGDCQAEVEDGGHEWCNTHWHSSRCCNYYSGRTYTVTISTTGTYRIDLYGGRGGTADLSCHQLTPAVGGNGGQVTGIITLNKGDVLTVTLGKKGNDDNTENGCYTNDDWEQTNKGDTGGSSTLKINGTTIATAYGGGGGEAYCCKDGSDWQSDGGPGSGSTTSYLSNASVIAGGNTSYDTGSFKLTEVHTHSYSSSVTKAATCTATGVRTYTCGCGDSYTETIAKNPSNHTGSEVYGGTSSVHTKWSCCGVTISSEHSMSSSVTTAATCLNTGIRTYTCGCGYSYTETIAALGHDCSKDIPLGTAGYEVAGQAGYFYTKNCSRCNNHPCVPKPGYFKQTIQVRYQQPDGTWGAYQTVLNEDRLFGTTVTWSQADNAEYIGKTVSYTVKAEPTTTKVDIYRKQYTTSIQVRYQDANGNWGSYSTVYNQKDYYGKEVSWSRAADAEYKAASIKYTVTKDETKYVDVYRQTYRQKVQISYQNPDGTWGDWETVIDKDYYYGSTCQWARAEDEYFQSASLSYKVTKADTKQVYIYRRLYDQKLIIHYENQDGTWWTNVEFDKKDVLSGNTVVWKWNPSDTRIYEVPRVAKDRNAAQVASLNYNINKDVTTELWAFRKLVTLDIDSTYLTKIYEDLNIVIGTVDVYVNGEKVADDVPEYYNDKLRFGSTWKVNDLKTADGYEYVGAYFTNFDELEYAPVLAAGSTWYKGKTSRSDINTITFVDKYTVTGAEKESWDGSANSTGEITCYILDKELIIAGNGCGRIIANTDSSYLLSDPSGKSYFNNVKTVSGLSVLDVSETKTFNSAFEMVGNNADTFIISGLETWNTSAAENMSYMFKGTGAKAVDWSIGNISKWDVQAVTTMKAMFSESGQNATAWTVGDVSKWNTISLTDASQMFYGAGANAGNFNINLTNFKMGNVTDLSNMLGYTGLKTTSWNIGDISDWNVSKVKNFSGMFNGNLGIVNLDLGGWNMTAATNTSKMFDGCYKLEEITLGTGFKFVSADGYLPSPSRDYIKDADGYWYNKDTLVEYSPAALAAYKRAKIETYTAKSPMDKPLLLDGTSFVAKIPSGITSIKFTDEKAPSGTSIIDVSRNNNGAVVAWKDGTTFKVSSQRTGVKIIAAADSKYMFDGTKNSVLKSVTSIDVSMLHTNNVTHMDYMFNQAGYNASTFKVLGLSNWTTSLVESMQGMFMGTGYNATSVDISGVETLDVSNVSNFASMFKNFAYKATSVNLDLGKWNTARMSNAFSMFYNAGYSASTFKLGDLGKWNTSNLNSINDIFKYAGTKATTWSIGDLSKWNVSKVSNFSGVFYGAGNAATTWNVGKLTDWNVSKGTTFANMFNNAGSSATTFDLGDLSHWNVAGSNNFSFMFNYAGNKATTWNVGDLSNWNVTKSTTFASMFNGAGNQAGTWSIGDLSKWKVDNSTDFSSMFSSSGNKTANWNVGDLSNWNTAKATTMYRMFYEIGQTAGKGKVYFGNIKNWNVSNVTNMEGIFYKLLVETLDLSGWNTRKVTKMSYAFDGMIYMKEITLGSDFVFPSNGKLDTPSVTYISGADGKWYDLETAIGYTPDAHRALVRDHAVTYSAQSTGFTVRHYTQDLYDTNHYSLAKTENKNGAANSVIVPSDFKTSLTGFTYKEAKVDGNVSTKTTILKDGSRVIELYYTRNSYKVSLVKGTGIKEVYGAGTYKYGDNVAISATLIDGYHWSSWTGTLASTVNEYKFTMPAKAVSNTATATTNIYYIRYNGNGSTSGSMSNSKHDYNIAKNLTTNSYARTGYVFAGWATSSEGAVVYADRASVTNLTTEHNGIVDLYAKWTPSNQIKYTVKHHHQDLGKTSYSLAEEESFVGTADSTIYATDLKNDYTGFTYSEAQVDGAIVTETTIKADGTRVINLYYTRNNYYFDLNGWLDGASSGNIAGYGVVDIYINGKLVGNNVSDYYAEHPYGSTYNITNISALAGHNYDGVKSGALEGKIEAKTNSTFLMFNRKICYIYFNPNGGENPPATQEFLFKSQPKLTTVIPTRVGYTFSHWEDDKGNKFTPGQTVPVEYADFTLKAFWTANNYSLTVNPNAGKFNGSTSNTVINGLYLTDAYVANPSRTGYRFNGWTLSGTGILGDSQTTDPKFQSGLNSVAVYNNTGNGTTTITRVARSSDNPTDSSYELKIHTTGLGNPGYGGFCHYSPVNEVAGDTFIHTFIAKVPKGYKLQLANNSLGTGGYYRWLTTNEGTGKFEVYSAEWYVGSGVNGSALPFVYVPNDGTTVVPFTWYLASSNIVKTNVKADGYIFKDGNGTLTANWLANTYYVRYNGNGSTSGSMSNSTHTYDTAKNLTANAFSKNGYTFKNWNLNSAGTSTSYANQASVKNLTSTHGATIDMYAQWTANTITITLNKNGGSGGTSTFYYVYNTGKYYSTSSCTTQITSVALPSKSGYHFVKYTGDGTCGGNSGEQYVATNGSIAGDLYYDIYKNATLTAQWEAHNYTNAITKQPTCTATGIRTYTCTVCGYQYTESVAALGHSMSGWSGWSDYSSSQHRRSRTCNRGCGHVEYGYANHNSNSYGGTSGVHTKCSTCGHTMSSSHSYTVDSGVQYSAANCNSPRYNYKKCACGYNPQSSSHIVATGNALGHNEVYRGISSWHTYCNRCGVGLSSTHSYSHSYDKAPTCTAGGTNRYKCACGYSYTTSAAALGHSMSGTTCTRCGYSSHTHTSSCYRFDKAPTTWRQTGGGSNNNCSGCGWYESETTCDWCGASSSGGEEWGCDYHYYGGMYRNWGGGDPDCGCGENVKICGYP